MVDFLKRIVTDRTVLGEGYLDHAAHQSMTAYLADWEEASGRLDRQIERLRAARDQRRADTNAGVWPAAPRAVPSVPGSSAATPTGHDNQ